MRSNYLNYFVTGFSAVGLIVFFTTPNVATGTPGALNDTGQTLCANESYPLTTCTQANTGDNTLYPRQDGRYGRDVQAAAGTLTKIGAGAVGFDFTKIANDGSELPATATLGPNPTDWACTRDNVTGLTWEIKKFRIGASTMTWSDADNFVIFINTNKLCGFLDWRLPEVQELSNIIYVSSDWYTVAIDSSYFPDMHDPYWTNKNLHIFPTVSFLTGIVNNNNSNDYFPVQYVRGERPAINSSYIDHIGTVTYQPNGLMWAKCSVGQTYRMGSTIGEGSCTGTGSYMDWASALQAARSSRMDGFNDWRLPNRKELESIVDRDIDGVLIHPAYFHQTLKDNDAGYWTSTLHGDGKAWVVYFLVGTVFPASFIENYAVRLVRNGSSFDALVGNHPFFLAVNKTGSGSGGVISNPAGIGCGDDCSEKFNKNTTVTLTAFPSEDGKSELTRWVGCNSNNESGTTCTVIMNTAKTVTATFTSNTLIVVKEGIGKGRVYSTPAGINCGSSWLDCNAAYKPGTKVTLKAIAGRDGVFAGWSGGCSGTAVTCVVTMSDNMTVHSTFEKKPRPDFAVTGLLFTPAIPVANSPFSVAVTVKNQGTKDGEGGYLDVWANQSTWQKCGAEGNAWVVIGPLAVGESKTFTLGDLRVRTVGSKNFGIFVDSWCETNELEEENNQVAPIYTVN